MIGAIILSSKAALSAFCGMVSVYVPKHANSIVQIAFPEALVQTDPEENFISYIPIPESCKAIGIGPGLGRAPETQIALIDFLKRCEKPLVIDADALNLLANIFRLEPNFKLPNSCILTPHSKEFDRLFGKSESSQERLEKQRDFSKKLEVIIVLKGAYTSITDTEGNCWFNTNGHPLLTTAGSGDVLTGIITSLLSKGETPILAARKGVYLHAQAAQQLALKGYKQIVASHLIQELPLIERIH
jgi:NAD(P)H-hydrate epimerase